MRIIAGSRKGHRIVINGAYLWFGVTGLILYTSAFVCEAIRSGVNAVSAGQAEAARSIGMTFGQSLQIVVLPQALRSVVGAFGVGGDLFSAGVTLTGAEGYAALPVFTGVALGYLAITIPAGLALGVIERRVAIAR